MKIFWTLRFERDFLLLPAILQKRVEKTLRLLETGSRHPSLHAKKIRGTDDVWEARISLSYRITYQTSGDNLVLRRVGTHYILEKDSR